jgi:hypothetical protein
MQFGVVATRNRGAVGGKAVERVNVNHYFSSGPSYSTEEIMNGFDNDTDCNNDVRVLYD